MKTDILIIGAGLVGTSLACALQSSGLKVTLLENHLVDINQAPKANSRPISLAVSSQQQLQRLQVWPALQDNACAIQNVHVSEQGAFGQLRFNAKEYDLDALGYVVPFDHLRHALYRQALQNEQHTIVCIEQLLQVTQHESHVEVRVKHAGTEQVYEARCLIAADGTRSQTRDLLNIDTKKIDHHEVAITASLQLQRQGNTAYERFTPQGTVALLPRPNKQAGMVWTMTPELAELAKTWSNDEWRQRLQAIIGYRMGRINSVKVTASYPLMTTLATQQTQQRAILLGNSAHTFYPIAAQGFNLSLRDAAALAHQLQSHGLDQLNAAFDAYLEQRSDDQQRVQKLISLTSQAFDLQLPGLGALRGKALLATASSPTLKSRLANRTLGLNQYPQAILSELRDD